MIYIFVALMALVGCGRDPDVEVRRGPQIPQGPVAVPPPVNPGDNPEVVDLNILESEILLDLATLSDNDRLNTRYLVGCNFYNEGLRDLRDIQSGVDVGINSISTESQLERVSPIGVGNCIYRIDLDSYGITRTEWKKISGLLLLDFISISTRNQQIQFLTQALKPYVFASDFFTTTTQADALTVGKGNNIYYDLIEQEPYLVDFYAQLGVVVQDEFDDESAVMAGFSQSQIALQKSRSILVMEANDGFVITTYDTSLAAQDSHFQNPFPIEAALAQGVIRSDKIFGANTGFAQEHIFNLPNGMLGYRLNADTNGGIFATEAPNDVVVNLNATQEGLDSTIFIGSCANCHSVVNPILQFTDRLKNHILTTGAFDALEKELADVFFNQVIMEGRTRRIASEYQASLQRLGAADSGDQDSLGKNIINPLRKEMGASQVAGYLLMPTNIFLERLAGSNASSQIFGSLISGGTVGLGVLSPNFNQLVEDVGAYKDNSLGFLDTVFLIFGGEK